MSPVTCWSLCWSLCWSSCCCRSLSHSPCSTGGATGQVGGSTSRLQRRPRLQSFYPCRLLALTARIIYEVPHCNSEPADVDQRSSGSSEGSSQWVSGALQEPGPWTHCLDLSSVSSSVRCWSMSPLITSKVCRWEEPSENLLRRTFSPPFQPPAVEKEPDRKTPPPLEEAPASPLVPDGFHNGSCWFLLTFIMVPVGSCWISVGSCWVSLDSWWFLLSFSIVLVGS